MTLKEFASLFHLSVNELCELTGFTRQGLNEMVKGNSAKNSERKRDARWNLKELSLTIRIAEEEAAIEAEKQRKEAIQKVFGII